MLRPIQKNSTIGVIAPAYAPDPDRLNLGIEYLHSQGYSVIKGKSTESVHGHFAGEDDIRLSDLHNMYQRSDVDAIFCARGGWGCLKYIDRIDYELIKKNPKALVGYSDITTLQLAIFQQTGLPSISGPMVAVEMGTGILDFTEKHFFDQVFNSSDTYQIDLDNVGAKTMKSGKASGTLLGGCLSLIASQIGTKYMPSFEGSILFIEDVGESSYKIDRYLAQIRQSGILHSVNGAILGQFLDCDPEEDDKKSFSITDILHEYFDHLKIPVIYNFPYGHGMKKISMPLGVTTVLDTQNKSLQFGNPFRSLTL